MKKSVNDLKSRAKDHPYESTRNLGCVTDLYSIGKSELLHLTHLSRNVRNWKRIDSDLPQIPSSRTGFDIPQSFQELQSGGKIPRIRFWT